MTELLSTLGLDHYLVQKLFTMSDSEDFLNLYDMMQTLTLSVIDL